MNYDLTKFYKNYKGLWIALDSKMNKVVSSGKNAKRVFNQASKKEGAEITLFKVPTKPMAFAGFARNEF